MTTQEILTETRPPDLLLAVIDCVDSYQQGGIANSPEQVAAALMLQRVLLESEV